MKKLVLTAALSLAVGPVLAADLPSRKEPVLPPPPAPPTWTGFHVGLNAGGVFGSSASLNGQNWNVWTPPGPSEFLATPLLSGSTASSSNPGFIGGGQIGYDWQTSLSGYGVLLGVEADIQGVTGTGGSRNRWLGAVGSENGAPLNVLSNSQGSSSLSYLGTVRGRIGFLATPTLLLYGTGGLAYGGVNANIRNTQIMQWADDGSSGVVYGANARSTTQVGWSAGAGVEWMFMPNWSARVEYLRYDLGRVSGSVVNAYYEPGNNGIESVTNYSGRVSGNIVRAGVNYHFDFGAPAVIAAKY